MQKAVEIAPKFNRGICACLLINFIHQAVEKYNETNINNK